MMKRTLGISLSVILHLTLLLIFIWPQTIQKVPPPPPPKISGLVEIHLIPTGIPIKSEVPTRKNGEAYAAIDPTICGGQNEKYKGIGIIHNFGSQRITEAPEQYPAYQAGLRLNDVILSISNQDDREDFVDVVISRNGVQMNFRIRKDTICFQKARPEPEIDSTNDR